MQIRDIIELTTEAIRVNNGSSSNEPSEWEVALKLHREELERGLSTISDRHVSHILARAVMIDANANNSAISAAIAQERLAESDRAVALRLAGLPVPPPIQQALAGLGTPTPPQTPSSAGLPPRLLQVIGTVPTPPQTPQGQTAPVSWPIRASNSQRNHQGHPAASQSRQSDESTFPGTQPAQANVSSGDLSNTFMDANSTLNNPIDRPKPPAFVAPGTRLPPPASSLLTFAPAEKFNPWSLAPAKKKAAINPAEVSPSPRPSLNGPSRLCIDDASSTSGSAVNTTNSTPACSARVNQAYNPKKVPIKPQNIIQTDSLTESNLPFTDIPAAGLPAPDERPSTVSTTAINIPIVSGQPDMKPQSTTSTANGTCTMSNIHKRKIGGEADDLTLAKRLDMGDLKGITTGTKRPQEDDVDFDQSSSKRLDTGVGKIIDLTNGHTIASTSVEGEEGTNGLAKDNRTADAFGSGTRLKGCVSCADEFEPAYISQMPCKHDYCHFCVQRVVINALVDEALYPPRCCKQPFDMDSMRKALIPELISGFNEKKAEFETTDRTYCSNPTCSAFLYPVNITGDKAACPMCFTKTCIICKGPVHNGDCPQDAATQQVLALANTEGWKRCGNCKRMIELKHGCNHIT